MDNSTFNRIPWKIFVVLNYHFDSFNGSSASFHVNHFGYNSVWFSIWTCILYSREHFFGILLKMAFASEFQENLKNVSLVHVVISGSQHTHYHYSYLYHVVRLLEIRFCGVLHSVVLSYSTIHTLIRKFYRADQWLINNIQSVDWEQEWKYYVKRVDVAVVY